MQTAYRDAYLPAICPSLSPRLAPSFPNKLCSREIASEVIYLVNGDSREREELVELLSMAEIDVVSFASAAEYLEFDRTDTSACLVVDMHLPDIGSFEQQGHLVNRAHPPVVFLSGPCDISTAVRAMKAGAIDILAKPANLVALLAAIRAGFAQDLKQRHRKAELMKLQERFSLLTPREREAFPFIVSGLLNKQSAAILGVSEITIRIHRGRVMRKMEATSFAELVRMAVKLKVPNWRGPGSAHELMAART